MDLQKESPKPHQPQPRPGEPPKPGHQPPVGEPETPEHDEPHKPEETPAQHKMSVTVQ